MWDKVCQEVGQSEQTQRAEVSGLWDTWSIWTMSIGVDCKESPTKGDMGCVCQKGKKVAKGDEKKICKCWKQRLFTIYQINKE
jgi:hypothetical protein